VKGQSPQLARTPCAQAGLASLKREGTNRRLSSFMGWHCHHVKWFHANPATGVLGIGIKVYAYYPVVPNTLILKAWIKPRQADWKYFRILWND
jgi:hypothetical protein